MNIPKKITMNDEDPYNIGDYSSSDDDRNESSDDELDIPVEGSKRQKQQAESSSEDEFEKEMDMELESVMRSYQNDHGDEPIQKVNGDQDKNANDANTNGNNTHSSNTTEDTANDMYDEEYFSSGSDDEHKVGGEASKSKERRKMLTNDELLYDPDMDDEDEQWVIKQRQDHRQKAQQKTNTANLTGTTENQGADSASKKKNKSKQNIEKVPTSDAILSCPACMTTLCIDCQRHDLYKHQYRAMFVMNCKVKEDEVLRYEPSQPPTSGKKRKKAQKGKLVQHTTEQDNTSSTTAVSERYYPVICTECTSEVAVYDSDEVYHFFNVLASHA